MTAGECPAVMSRMSFRNSTMSMESFEQFRQIVLHDVALQERLRAVIDRPSFVELIVRVGGERGCHFTPEDVEAAMRANRQLWIERWI